MKPGISKAFFFLLFKAVAIYKKLITASVRPRRPVLQQPSPLEALRPAGASPLDAISFHVCS